ncbi:tetratricopeptide repeat protein [Tumebacillus permanentifrigoris]|uniref:Tetratricopeptide repeat protein n=1 Tax=Tumebacillus permanentifrigoris TaxID=378543 RepID=A0A316D4Y3_9BACL|nr:tetratricopeptide repeat protein [Tumebacillus permanentifrigoris]PWK08366.1 tetratricopeptide repeat protein [Tumebacillus permanentifrigoris]
MKAELTHRWIAGATRCERVVLHPAASERTFLVSADSRLRGPCTGTGDLLRQLIPHVLDRWPELVQRHVVEILSIAPELKAVIPTSRETLTSLAVPSERTRYYSRLRTLRIAHGLVDFFKKLAEPERLGRIEVVYEDAHACETLDAEFLSVLLRRMEPSRMGVTVCSKREIAQEALRSALEQFATCEAAPAASGDAEKAVSTAELPEAERLALAQRFVDADGTSECSAEQAAYHSIAKEARQAMHDRRADELTARNEWTWHLGAIPWHREHGSSRDAALRSLMDALEYCIQMGFYDATVDFGQRGREWVTWSEDDFKQRWIFTTKMTTSLAALGRPEEAEALFDEVRANTEHPSIHMPIAYSMAMLYTRHHSERDHDIARTWIERAIQLASEIETEKERVFHTVFYQNGQALIELHVGRIEEALDLVSAGLERLNHHLEPNEHLLHRSVLIFNKAQILAAVHRYDEAVEAYTTVIQHDPNYPEYYFDRGNLFSKMGRLDDAIADYTHAIEISPPFPEVYYNRAGVYNRQGEVELALADYSYLLELEPTHIDGRLNRATLLLEAGDPAAARQDVEAALNLEPKHAQLLCILGLIEMAEERNVEAKRAFTAALAADASLLEAYVNLSVLLFELEDAEGAVEVLSRALEDHPQSDVLYFNRAWALQALGRWEAAFTDYSMALDLQSDESHEILFQRGSCLLELGRMEEAYADWKQHLEAGESPYLETIQQLAPTLG